MLIFSNNKEKLNLFKNYSLFDPFKYIYNLSDNISSGKSEGIRQKKLYSRGTLRSCKGFHDWLKFQSFIVIG